MNLKKTLLSLFAIFMSLPVFAGNTPDLRPVFDIHAESTFTLENRSVATAYAYTRFFDAFAARVAEGNMTANDKEIVSVVENQMLPALRAKITEAENAVNNPQTPNAADNQIEQAEKQLVNLMVKEFDLQEINAIIARNQHAQQDSAPVFTVQDLYQPVLNLAAADLALSYLAEKGELTAEEQIVLELFFKK